MLHQAHNLNNYGRALMSALPQVIASNSHTRVRVRVASQLTVCQSVRLGVEPTLGLVTRC
jgi:hypothetical protein